MKEVFGSGLFPFLLALLLKCLICHQLCSVISCEVGNAKQKGNLIFLHIQSIMWFCRLVKTNSVAALC